MLQSCIVNDLKYKISTIDGVVHATEIGQLDGFSGVVQTVVSFDPYAKIFRKTCTVRTAVN